MGAIFGIVRWDERPVEPELGKMRRALSRWGPDGANAWCEGSSGVGSLALHATPESVHGEVPFITGGDRYVITASARLDNRNELLHTLGVDPGLRPQTSDARLISLAHDRWGEECFSRLIGDWSCALWDRVHRRLIVARDQTGNVSVYYRHVSGAAFVFASGIEGVLATMECPRVNQELVARYLSLEFGGNDNPLFYEGVSCIKNGNFLIVERERLSLRRYWSILDAPDVRLRSDEEYLEAFLDLFSEAVRCRLRARRQVATTLSSGLDSGAVTALAAREMALRGERLTALTSAPLYPCKNQRADETPMARQLVDRAGNLTHVIVTAADVTPLAGISRSLDIYHVPEHAVANAFWLHSMLDETRRRGADVLLTGQMGNLGVSYNGGTYPIFHAIRAGQWSRAFRELRGAARGDRSWLGAFLREFVRPLMAAVGIVGRRLGFPGMRSADRFSIIQETFAQQVGLSNSRGLQPDDGMIFQPPRTHRAQFLDRVLTFVGTVWHALPAAYGIEVRDPTADSRLLTFCLGLPDDMFLRDGCDRWIMRKSMREIMPPSYLQAKLRGRQAADLPYRLLAERADVDRRISEMCGSPAADCVDYDRVAQFWRTIQEDPSTAKALMLSTHLMRGLEMGMFLNGSLHASVPSVPGPETSSGFRF